MERWLTESKVRGFAFYYLVGGASLLLLWHVWAADWIAKTFDLSSVTLAGVRVEGFHYYLPAMLFALVLFAGAVLIYPVLGEYWTKGMSLRMHAVAALFLWGTYLGNATGIASSAVELGATIFVSLGILGTGIVFHLREKAGYTGFFSSEGGKSRSG